MSRASILCWAMRFAEVMSTVADLRRDDHGRMLGRSIFLYSTVWPHSKSTSVLQLSRVNCIGWSLTKKIQGELCAELAPDGLRLLLLYASRVECRLYLVSLC